MWVFLSARLRRWLLFAIAVPVAHGLVHWIAERMARRDPHGKPARSLGAADRTLMRLRRRSRHG
jgi:hypothetical protein